ncbi:MAG: hypothetical protein ACRDYB_03680 [Acidimicrobiales bacterium]
MRARLVMVLAVVLLLGSVTLVAGARRAFAADGDGQYTYANAHASGGQVTVKAGQTVWTPPTNSRWATDAQSDPPPGKPNSNQPYGCTYQVDVQGVALLGAGGPTPGQWVIPYCAGPGVIDPMPAVWVSGTHPGAAAVAQVNPAVVADQAVKHLGFGSPTIEMAPPTGHAQLVGVATWLWIDPNAWKALSASASAGAVTATATATPTKVVWDMGDGASVTCAGPGTPYNSSEPDGTTRCSFTWPQAGSYTVTAAVFWSVTWTATGAPGGGNLGVQAGPAAEVAVRVTESQAINTPTGGAD